MGQQTGSPRTTWHAIWCGPPCSNAGGKSKPLGCDQLQRVKSVAMGTISSHTRFHSDSRCGPFLVSRRQSPKLNETESFIGSHLNMAPQLLQSAQSHRLTSTMFPAKAPEVARGDIQRWLLLELQISPSLPRLGCDSSNAGSPPAAH